MLPEDEIKGEWIKAADGVTDVFIGEAPDLPDLEDLINPPPPHLVVHRDDTKIAEMLKDPERIKQAKEALQKVAENK